MNKLLSGGSKKGRADEGKCVVFFFLLLLGILEFYQYEKNSELLLSIDALPFTRSIIYMNISSAFREDVVNMCFFTSW